MFVSNAQAATTYTVTGSGDTGGSCTGDQCTTLRAAVNAANIDGGADTITFDSSLSGDTITLSDAADYGVLNIDDGGGLTITGPTGGITVSGGGDTQIFDVSGGGPTTISGLTITDGSASEGGAVDVSSVGGTTLADDTISDSTATSEDDDQSGGGIFSTGPLTVTGTTVTGNTATSGDGGGIGAYGDNADVTITNSTISGNTASGDGGGFSGGHTVTITGTKVLNNTAADDGGGLELSPKYGATVTTSTISGNTATSGFGGGVAVYNEIHFEGAPKYDPIQIQSSTISGNQAPDGAGVAADLVYSPVTISSSTISGNGSGSTVLGGGLELVGGVRSKFRLADSTISGNTAQTGGAVGLGGTNNGSQLETTYEGTTGSIAFDNSTIDANSATVHGGGIYLGEYQTGGSTEYSGTASLTSTIVANNTLNGAGEDLERASGSTSGGFDGAFSLIQNPGSAPLTQNEVITGKDPQLNPLASNGGPTETMEPKSTSPAIDQGHASPNLTTDQNGNKRTVVNQGIAHPPGGDGTDIGSVELQPGQAFIPPAPPAQSPGFSVSINGKSLGPSPALVFRYETPVTCSLKHGSLASCVIEVHATNGLLIADGEVIGNNPSLTAKVIRTPAGYAALQKNPLAGVGATMTAIGSPTGLPTLSGKINFLAGQSLRFHITSNDLTGTLKAQLSELAKVIAGVKEVSCTAFTDRPKGDTTSADAKADKSKTAGEAQAVCSYLGRHGLSGAKFTAIGKGHANPIGSNKTRAGRSENKRVKISFTF